MIAIERDERAIAALAEIAAHYPGRLAVIAGDALTFDAAPLSRRRPGCASSPTCPTTSRRPAGRLAHGRALAALVRPARADVPARGRRAHRRHARHRRPTAGSRCWPAGAREAKILFDIAPSAFVPPPKVTSSRGAARAARRARCPAIARALERVTAAAFGQRRKMLRAEPEVARASIPLPLLENAAIDPTARAEDIPVEGFVALAQRMSA